MAAQAADVTRLAAIVFTDIVGYSARVHRDAEQGKRALDQQRATVRRHLGAYGGREIETAGDSFLLLFDSTASALSCVAEIQRSLAAAPGPDEPVRLRSSIHLGDIEIRADGVFGDGVNIAARILPHSPEGGVALSDLVHRQLKNRLPLMTRSLGMPPLKNIEQPVEIFVLDAPGLAAIPARPVEPVAPAAVHPALHKRQDEEAGGRSATLIWKFANAEFDERALELLVAGEPVELERKPLEILRHLLWHAGEVVTRDELLDAVWPGRILSESVINKCISRLREVLRDGEQQIIRTAHGYGYKLIAEVKVEHPKSTPLPAPRFGFKAGDSPPLRPSWKLRDRLGVGGHGEAWLAEHEKTREKRVYKFAFDDRALVALKREITLYRLLHDTLGERPDFVKILDWNLDEAPCFTEAEHVEGGNLLLWGQQQGGIARVPQAVRVELAAQIAETLAAAHAVGVLHKDLKPSNVVIEARDPAAPRIKLMDFGSGGVINPQKLDQLGITRLGFTQMVGDDATSTSGTPLYFAPEVVAGYPMTMQSDIYALGIVLYQLAIGDLKRPLAPGWEMEVTDELLREDIAEAAHGNPQHRLKDAAELAKRLRTLAERRALREQERAQRQREQDALAAAAHARHENEKLRARRTGLLAAVAILVVGLAASTKLYLDARAARADAEYRQAQAEALANFLQWDFVVVTDPKEYDTRALSGIKVLLDAAVPKVETRLSEYPLAATKVMEALSAAYRGLGYDSEARGLDRQRLDAAKRLLVDGHPDALEVGVNLSVVFHYEHDDDEYMHRLAEAAAQQWAPDDTRRLMLEWGSAGFHFSSGNYARYRTMLDEIERRLATADRASPFHKLINIPADRLYERIAFGDYRAAEEQARAAIASGNPRANWPRLILIDILLDTGRLEEAEDLLTGTLTLKRQSHSESHGLVRFLRAKMGKLRVMQGRPGEAYGATDAVVAEFGAEFEHQGQVTWQDWPGRQYVLEGRYALAEKALARRLERAPPTTVDPDSPYVTKVRLLLIEALVKQGKVAEAREQLALIPPLGIEKLQASTKHHAWLLRVQGLVAAAEGRRDEAVGILEQASALAEKVYGERSYWTRQVAGELAAIREGSRIAGKP